MTPDQIRTTYESLDLTQAEFGRLTGWSRAAINRACQPGAVPPEPLIATCRLINALGPVRALAALEAGE